MYRDSVEVDELKHPLRVESLGLVPDSAGAGRHRGTPAQQVTYTPLENNVTVIIPCDGQVAPPRGVLGGQDGTPGETWLIGANGDETKLPNLVNMAVQKGQTIRGRDSSGAGYGNPVARDPARVLRDVLEGWESRDKAAAAYGVIFTGDIDDETLAVDAAATASRRSEIAAGR